jgi:hypothetical protein
MTMTTARVNVMSAPTVFALISVRRTGLAVATMILRIVVIQSGVKAVITACARFVTATPASVKAV